MVLLAWFFILLTVGIIVYGVFNHRVTPHHILWIRGEHDYIAYSEAPDDEGYCAQLNSHVIDEIRRCNDVPLLVGSPDEWKKPRQLLIHPRRNKR